MKKIISISLLLLIVIASVKAERISLKDALDKKIVTATIKQGSANSTHYHSPFVANIKNNSKDLVEIVLENGHILTPDSEDFQHFIVTRELIVKLKPYENTSKPVYAMCIKRNLSAPINSTEYKPSALASKELVKLSTFIEKTKTFEPNAQFLLWEIIDNKERTALIDTFELYNENQVRALAKTENGKRAEVLFGYEQEAEQEYIVLMEGSFSMEFGFPRNVHIAMFNMQNVIVKELYNNPKTPVGKTLLGYNFNSLDYPDEEYKINLVVNGEVLMTRKVDMKKN